MNIWLLTIGELLPLSDNVRKLRVPMLADTLVARGHNVLWWTSAFEHQRKIWVVEKDREIVIQPNYKLYCIRGCGYKKNVSLARYIDHRIIAHKFRKLAPDYPKPDIIVASMPCYHLAYEGALYAHAHNIPFVVDIRDLWPDIFWEHFPAFLQWCIKCVLWQDSQKLRKQLRLADAIVAMSEGVLKWGLEKISRSRQMNDRVFYLGYCGAKVAERKEKQPLPSWAADLVDKKIFLFSGTFGRSYELALIIEVARKFYDQKREDVVFVLAGTGEQFRYIQQKSSGLTNVILPGWISQDEIQQLLKISWAGLVACKAVLNAMPNKVFEYLSAGLPLISSLEGEMAGLIDKYGLGFNYRVGDFEGLYQSIVKLAADEQLRNKIAENCLRFFQKFGNAEVIYNEYADFLESLVK
jgi:glycosyltransferase involved in cell wall biosynthesis